MNVLSKLSIKNLKMNKKRTISTIVGIILSIALICGVGTLCTSFRESLIQSTIDRSGYWHLNVNNVSAKQEQELEHNIDIGKITKIQEIGYGKLDGIINPMKPYLKLYSMSNDSFKELRLKLTEGRFPQNKNEVIISRHLNYNGGLDYKIGDEINLDIGQRKTLDDYDVSVSNPYNKDDEKIVNSNNITFKVVGIIERPSYDFEKHQDPGYSIISTGYDKGKNNFFLSFKEPKDYKNTLLEIFELNDYKLLEYPKEDLKFEDFVINNELLRWQVLDFGATTMNMITTVAGIAIAIIIFTSVFCIRNSFAISTTEKTKLYGMLSSVGTTKKQIRKNVIFEALILGVIGIPLGIIGGLFAIFVLIKVVNILVGNFILNGSEFVFRTSPLVIILSIILGFITVYLSAISSARKASKVSPIENLRNSDKIKLNNKDLKTPKFINKIFGTGGVIAYKNLKRSKKKYRTTVISLTVSIFIFIVMNSFLHNMFGMSNEFFKDMKYNIEISYRDPISSEDVIKILNLGNIKESHIIYGESNGSILLLNDKSKFTIKQDKFTDENTGDVIYKEADEKYLPIIGLDKNTYNNYLKELGIKKVENVHSGILYDYDIKHDEKGKSEGYRVYNYEQGDTIRGKLIRDGENFDIVINAITKEGPIGFERNHSSSGFLFINIDDYKDFTFNVDRILIDSDDPNTFESKFIKEFKNLNCDNIYKISQEEKAVSIVISIFLYGFITVITLIGVTNIFNTITSNIELRQKEFAMLKSIGMTKKEFNRMVNLETLFYSTKSLIYGIVLGLLGTFAFNKAFSIKIESGMYIPIIPIIISIIAVFILVFIIMRYSINKINKKNTIETIRNENI